MSFPCSRCGACCKNLHHIKPLASFHSGDGICNYYSESLGCRIYQHRPLLCRIDEGYEVLFSRLLDKKSYYEKNARACNLLQKQAGLDDHFRVKLI